jgi:hypothetical protein
MLEGYSVFDYEGDGNAITRKTRLQIRARAWKKFGDALIEELIHSKGAKSMLNKRSRQGSCP